MQIIEAVHELHRRSKTIFSVGRVAAKKVSAVVMNRKGINRH